MLYTHKVVGSNPTAPTVSIGSQVRIKNSDIRGVVVDIHVGPFLETVLEIDWNSKYSRMVELEEVEVAK